MNTSEPGDDADVKAATSDVGAMSAPEARASVARGPLPSEPSLIAVRVYGGRVRLEVYMPEHDDWLVNSLTVAHARVLRDEINRAIDEASR